MKLFLRFVTKRSLFIVARKFHVDKRARCLLDGYVDNINDLIVNIM